MLCTSASEDTSETNNPLSTSKGDIAVKLFKNLVGILKVGSNL